MGNFPFLTSRLKVLVICIVAASALTCCEDEKAVDRSYPRLKTFEVTNITEEGVTFMGEIYALGNEAINEYGFVWSEYNYPTLGNGDKVPLGIPETECVFTADVRSAIVSGVKYSMRTYAITDEHVVYGKRVFFVGKGCKGPELLGFYPESAGWGDTVFITGKDFSWVPQQNLVWFNSIESPGIYSTDTTIKVILPANVNVPEITVSVSLLGKTSGPLNKKLTFIPPAFEDYSPKQGKWGDTITLTGRKIGYISYPGNQIKLGTVVCSRYVALSSNTVMLFVPHDLRTISSQVELKISGISLTVTDPFVLVPVSFTFSPASGTPGTNITLTGRFNTTVSSNEVRFNNTLAQIISTTVSTLVVRVPINLSPGNYTIKYISPPFTVLSATSFAVL
jgi:hypothetical protein